MRGARVWAIYRPDQGHICWISGHGQCMSCARRGPSDTRRTVDDIDVGLRGRALRVLVHEVFPGEAKRADASEDASLKRPRAAYPRSQHLPILGSSGTLPRNVKSSSSHSAFAPPVLG